MLDDSNGLDAISEHGAMPTDISLDFPSDMTADQWEDIGRKLCQAENRLQWLWGDWWAYGEHKYGERSALVNSPDWQGPKFNTLAQYARVARRFETCTRIQVLTFKHHQVCAGSKIAHRTRLMEKAAAEGWPARKLEDQIRSVEGKSERKERPPVEKTTYREQPTPDANVDAEQAFAGSAVEIDAEQESPISEPAKPTGHAATPKAKVQLAAALKLLSDANNLLGGEGVLDRSATDMAALRRAKRLVHVNSLMEISSGV